MHRILSTVTACLALAVAVAVLHVHEARAGGDETPARPYLGVSLSDLGDRQRDRLDLDPGVEGALVTDVRRDSPADEAGLREHDVIVEVEGVRVSDTDAAIAAIRSLEAGARITLTVNRGGLERTLTATLDEWPEPRNRWFGSGNGFRFHGDGDAPRVFRFHADGDNGIVIRGDEGNIVIGPDEDIRIERRDGQVFVYRGDEDDPEVIDLSDDDRVVIVDRDRRHGHGHGGSWTLREPHHAPRVMRFGGNSDGGFLGVQSQALTDQLRTFFGVDEDHGVLVTDVVEGSPAADAGLRAGDVILEVDGEAVSGPAALRAAVRGIEPGREADLRIVRDRSARTVSARLARAGDFSDAAPFPGNSWFGLHPERHRVHLGDLGLDLDGLHEHLDELRHELHRELPRLHGELREGLRHLDEEEIRDLHEEIRRGLGEIDLDGLREEIHRELPRIHEELRRNLHELDEEEIRDLHEEIRRGLEEMRHELRNSDVRFPGTRREPDFTRDAA